MEIILKTINKGYSITTDGTIHYLNFGKINKGEAQTAVVGFKDITAKTFSLQPTCGCTTTAKKIISPTEVEYTITFSGRATLPKTLIITNNNKQIQFKIDGHIQG